MRSWQRVFLAGVGILVVGSLLAVVDSESPHGAVRHGVSVGGIILIGIGGSVIASALVSWLIARQVFGIDVGDAIEALRGASSLTRANQTLEITLKRIGDQVHVAAQHRFDVFGSAKVHRRRQFSLYTDAARWGSGGGFFSILEPDGNELTGKELDLYISKDEGKVEFSKVYKFHPSKPSHFEVETFGHFRRRDRLIWTVEHISSDFSVRILDRREEGKASVKINHHRRAEVSDDMKDRSTSEGREIEFAFLGEVLPFQGFELQWGDDSGS
ncbi:MAG TPA: hypothetical protein VFJ64_11655 [Solirubrobacterales bacterium]|nr:hypothetical protein [Solirubrobacterales bacterium]